MAAKRGLAQALLQGGCLLTPSSFGCCCKHMCLPPCCMHPFSICNWTNWNCWQLYHDLKTSSNSLVHFRVRLMPVEASWESVHHHDDAPSRIAPKKPTIDFGLSLIMDAIHYTIYYMRIYICSWPAKSAIVSYLRFRAHSIWLTCLIVCLALLCWLRSLYRLCLIAFFSSLCFHFVYWSHFKYEL